MGQLQDIWRGLDWSALTGIIISVVPSLLCLTVHELCHGLAAYALGDNTAKNMGRLTLNPLRHLDPMGLLMMMIVKFGWAKPVPVNPNNFKNPKRGMVLTALAGPMSNLGLAVLMFTLYGLVWRYTELPASVLNLLEITAFLSISLAIFNMLPIPPLDGSKVVFGLGLSDKGYSSLLRNERYGMLILIALSWSGIITGPLSRATYFVFEKLSIIALWIMQAGR